MRIAQIAPLAESVPPRLYGGTERIVSYLTEELVRQGHEVVLFASGDSITSAELVACSERALRLDPRSSDMLAHHVFMLEQARRRAELFDVLHFHVDYLHFPVFRDFADKTLTTLHGRLDLWDIKPVFRLFRDMPLSSISASQRLPLPDQNWVGTVHHGIPVEHYAFSAKSEDYLAFLGRISPEKRVDRAVEIAKAAGLPLRIAAKIDKVDQEYFDTEIAHRLRGRDIHFIGEIGDAQKSAFLGGARALLFPIDWPEPFGLVMLEAMACGTPVIAWNNGSIPEIIEPGVTGFIVESVEEAVAAVHKAARLDRHNIRERCAARFNVERMARDYVRIYRNAMSRARPRDVVELSLAARGGRPLAKGGGGCWQP